MYFLEWPFGVVPEDSPSIWADRHNLKQTLEKLLKNTIQRNRSVMLGMWGYVGAGKSHSLLFFKNILETNHQAFVIYSTMPKQIKSFSDVYKQAFFRNLDFIKFANTVGKVYQNNSQMTEYQLIEMFSKKITNNWLDMAIALLKLGKADVTGGALNPYISLINSWLSGMKLPKSDLRQLGLSANLTYDSDFVKAATSIIKIMSFSNEKSEKFPMIIWMIDDCHYLAELKRQYRTYAAIQQGLRDLFDLCPRNLCIIFAFAARQASALEELIIPDLLSRIQEKVHVSPLDKEEALTFIRDLFGNTRFRSQNAKGDYYPLTTESAAFLVDSVVSTADLTPRNLMKMLGFLVTKAEDEIYPKVIDIHFISQYMEQGKEVLMQSETED